MIPTRMRFPPSAFGTWPHADLTTIAELGFADIDLVALPGFWPRTCASSTCAAFGVPAQGSIDNRHEYGENSTMDWLGNQ